MWIAFLNDFLKLSNQKIQLQFYAMEKSESTFLLILYYHDWDFNDLGQSAIKLFQLLLWQFSKEDKEDKDMSQRYCTSDGTF